MRYIILTKDHLFYTKWFNYENHWQEGMTVIDLTGDAYTTNGKEWQEIEFDHL